MLPDICPITNNHFGYQPDPVATSQFVDTLRHPTFADVMLALPENDNDALVYRAITQLMGVKLLPARDQGQVGSCTGNGGATAIDLTTACQIVYDGNHNLWRARASAEYTYAASRQITNNLSNQDGSYGAAVAKAITNYGTIHQLQYSFPDGEQDNLTKYSANLCKQWGARGVPADLITAAAPHKMHTTTKITTWQQARSALQNGYGISVCSQIGFDGGVRDQNGFMPVKGVWPHCMAAIAYRGQSSGKQGFLIHNSWGDSWASGPLYQDQPLGSFYVTTQVFQTMLNAGDTFAYSTYDGFPAQSLDWLSALGA